MRALLLGMGGLWAGCFLAAEPFSRATNVDFFRETPSRNLRGLAVRSDGRLTRGPQLRELKGAPPADLFWSLAPGSQPTEYFLGTGPLGRIYQVKIDAPNGAYTTTPLCSLEDAHVFVLRRLADGSLLAGTSPLGLLVLIRDGKVAAQMDLPVDSVLDILMEPAVGAATESAPPKGKKGRSEAKVVKLGQALVATGNPGRIYRVDLDRFAEGGRFSGLNAEPAQLSERGITLWGEIRDRNVRRIARLVDGRVVAGSAPKGNLYVFPAAGGAPTFLQENREAEVTDLLPRPEGGLYALVVSNPSTAESRINRVRGPEGSGAAAGAAPAGAPGNPPQPPAPGAAPAAAAPTGGDTPLVVPVERFAGRTQLLAVNADGYIESLMSRSNLAYYRLLAHDGKLLLAGGEQGDLAGYDPVLRVAYTYAGSASAQLNELLPWPEREGAFVVMRNNAPGLALLDFNAAGPREAETKRVDLGTLGAVGMLRSARLRGLAPGEVRFEVRTNVGADEVEGWSPWVVFAAEDAAATAAPAWRPPAGLPRARYGKLRVRLAESLPADFALDRLVWHYLPQNRRPQLAEFRVLAPNFGLIPASENAPAASTTLNNILNPPSGGSDGAAAPKRRGNFLNSHVVPAPGTQLFIWSVQDADGDAVACTLQLRRDGEDKWIDVVVDTQESYAQIELPTLEEGVYFTRLTLRELAPRPEADRLAVTYEADDFIVDRTPPEIFAATARREGDRLRIEVQGRDARTLLAAVEVLCNNGAKEVVEQPVDGIRDGREETFVVEIPWARTTGASAAEVTLYDAAGNAATRRVRW